MTDPQDDGESWRRIDMVLVTDQPIPAYGGIQLSTPLLYDFAEKLRSGQVPMTVHHDPRRRTDIRNLEVGVRQRPDGFHEVWATGEMRAADWDRYERERTERGAPGGMSLTMSTDLAVIDGPPDSPFSFRLAADAHHFTDEEIKTAGESLSPLGTVSCERMYQFSFDPPSAVVLTFVLQSVAAIPPNLVASYIWESVKDFFGKGKDGTSLTLEFEERAGERTLTAVIPPTTEAKVAERALQAFEAVATQRGLYEYDGEVGEWRAVKR